MTIARRAPPAPRPRQAPRQARSAPGTSEPGMTGGAPPRPPHRPPWCGATLLPHQRFLSDPVALPEIRRAAHADAAADDPDHGRHGAGDRDRPFLPYPL